MKLNEFKAWFEGYTESMDGTPSKKQWERIKEQVKDVDGVAVSYPVYIDRYVKPYWSGPWYSNNLAYCGTSSNTNTLSSNTVAFNGANAMYAAGKAEALSQAI